MWPGSKLLRLLVALVIGPTSLNEGEGLLPGRRVWLERSWGGEDEGGGLQNKGRGHRKTRSIRKLIKGQRRKPHQQTNITMDTRVIRNNEGTRREERAASMIDDRKQEQRPDVTQVGRTRIAKNKMRHLPAPEALTPGRFLTGPDQ